VKAGAVAKPKLELKPNERLHEPAVEMPWIPVAGRMKVTLVDVADPPGTSKLVVWGAGQRHDVVTIKAACLGGEHGAELWTGAKNTVVFRCESQGPTKIVADEWLIRWPGTKAFPTIYRHWQGRREQRDPKWAGGRRFYGTPAKEPPPDPTCCCSWQDEGDDSFEVTTKEYCKGSSDHHGICVADSKCPADDDP
jgi:hypothetical protein